MAWLADIVAKLADTVGSLTSLTSFPVHSAILFFIVLVQLQKWSIPIALASAVCVGLFWQFLERFLNFEDTFQVVYVTPVGKASEADEADGSKAPDGTVVASGCKLKQMAATSAPFDRHLTGKNLACIKCPLFDDMGREWVLYGWTPVEGVANPKKAINLIASKLAGMQMKGSAVVVPADRKWRPKGHGKLDWMSGNARMRLKEEAQDKTVSLAGVLAAVDLADKRGSCQTDASEHSGHLSSGSQEDSTLMSSTDASDELRMRTCKKLVSTANSGPTATEEQCTAD